MAEPSTKYNTLSKERNQFVAEHTTLVGISHQAEIEFLEKKLERAKSMKNLQDKIMAYDTLMELHNGR